MLIAGELPFRERILGEAEKHPDYIRIVSIASNARDTVDNLQRLQDECDAVLLGFNDEENEIVLRGIIEYSRKTVAFVAIKEPISGFKRWACYQAVCAISGKELSTIVGYFNSLERTNTILTASAGNTGVEKLQNSEVDISQRDIKPVKTAGFFSFKGGVGKSILTTSIAMSIAAHTDLSVCVVDLDCSRNYGDIIKYLGFVGKNREQVHHTLVSWKGFPRDQFHDWQVVEEHLIKIRPRLYVLPAIRSMAETEKLGDELIRETVNTLSLHLNLILFDLGNFLTDYVIAAMELSDDIFLVNTMDIPEIDSLHDFIQNILPELRIPQSRMHLVFNRVIQGQKVSVEDAAAYVGLPCTAAIPEDMGVRLMVTNSRGQVPFVGSHNMPFTREVEKILLKLLPQTMSSFELGRSSHGFRGFLRKMGIG